MTLYLTDATPPGGDRPRAKASGCIVGCKLYPAGATTHSDAGVTDVAAHRCGARAHGRARHGAAGARRGDRPAGRRLRSRGALHRRGAGAARGAAPAAAHRVRAHHHARRRSTSCAARAPASRATVTPQHLLMNRNALFAGGLRPHHYCLPVLKARARTAPRCWRRSPAAARGCFSAPTAPRTRAAPRKPRAAAPASSPRTPASSCTPRLSRRPARWTSSRRSPRSTAPTFYGLPRNEATVTLTRERVARAGAPAVRR